MIPPPSHASRLPPSGQGPSLSTSNASPQQSIAVKSVSERIRPLKKIKYGFTATSAAAKTAPRSESHLRARKKIAAAEIESKSDCTMRTIAALPWQQPTRNGYPGARNAETVWRNRGSAIHSPSWPKICLPKSRYSR